MITYLLSPEFQGFPAWPTTRQAYLVVRTPDQVILASDGMSDLFVDTSIQDAGFGSEVFIETDALQGAGIEQVRASWHFQLIENFAQNVADAGGLGRQLERYGILSFELPAPDNVPSEWVTRNGSVGALINLQVPGREASCSLAPDVSIAMVPLTLILPDELDFVVANGADGRRDLAARLNSSRIGLSSPEVRASVLQVTRKSSFAPVTDDRTRLLILGSLPGEVSLAEQRYYAHPRNRFWHLVGQAIGCELESLSYDERLNMLLAHHVGLWDTIASAERRGSLDAAIRNEAHNPLADLAATLPALRAVAFNGAKSAKTGRKLLAGSDLTLIDLPSSSPAHAAMPLARKEELWRHVGDFVR